jgi:Tol biopolymer transport system component
MRRSLLPTIALPVCALLTGLFATPSTPAVADVFGPISLVSESGSAGAPTGDAQQAVYAHDPAISGDGRYVAFDGSFGGETGVFRRDLATGVVEAVAVGATGTPAGSAELPSISRDGRYVSFTTTAALSPEDDNEAPDVYVRDMQARLGEPAYALASAVDGSTQGLSYEPEGGSSYGSVAGGRSALSADGREVVFVTTAISNLAGAQTPALQVAVRDLDTDSTRLVSVAYDPATGRPAVDPITKQQEPVSGEEGGLTYGAVYSPSLPPPAFGPPAAYGLQSPVRASISADGSTVAWMGQDVSRQAQVLSDETLPAQYSEPLWRRIADGPEALTRRITGGSDPSSPACEASGESALAETTSSSDPCQGPFRTEGPGVWTGGIGNPVPQLSADGWTVAFLAGAPPIGGTFGGDVLNDNSDLYVVDMAGGLTRTQALRPLTELASGNAQDPATTAPIVDLAISPDGSQVAYTTQRTVFPLGSPAYVTAPAATPGMVELFDVDLADNTLTRVTHGFTGGAGEAPHGTEVPGQDPYTSSDGALSPSFSDDGDTLAFSSTAANLVYGDGNTPQQSGSPVFDGSDAFVVSRVVFGETPAPQYISSAPSSPSLSPAWHLGVSAFSRPNGTVLLEIEAPGAGALRVAADSAVRVKIKARPHNARPSRHVRDARLTVAKRTVATRNARAHDGGLMVVTLKLARPYDALAGARGGLSTTVSVTFSAHDHPTLRESVAATFLRRKPPARHRRGARTPAARPDSSHEGSRR